MITDVGRRVDTQRPEELREAIVQYLIEHGLSDLSLRPLAKAVGSSPRGLLYHFESKEKMVVAVIAEIRQRQQTSFAKLQGQSFGETCWLIWKQLSSNDSEPVFRLFFEAYGLALSNPGLYQDFLRATVEDWVAAIAEPRAREGATLDQARAFATVVLAGLRGFMLDYCTTHDRYRLDRAVRLWVASLDRMLSLKVWSDR